MATSGSFAPILVTGAAGFIGSRFVESCNRLGIAVISVDHIEQFTQRTEHAGIKFGKTIDCGKVLEWLDESRPRLTAIIHMGAITSTTEMNRELLNKVNVELSKSLWKHCTQESIPFIYASSAATYGDGALGYDDDEKQMAKLQPLNPYGESKKTFDLWALEENRAGRRPPVWSGHKFFNVYGLGESHKGSQASVVLHAYDQIRKKGSVRLFKSHRAGIADGHQKRDFVSVDDVVKVLHFALKHPLPQGIYNLGTGKARTFLELTQAVFKAMGAPEKIEFIDTPVEIRERYQYFTEAKMDKLRTCGYQEPFASLEEGVKQYIGLLK